MTSEIESSFTCLLAIYIIGELFLRYILFRPLDSKLQVFLLWWQLIYSIGFAFPFFFVFYVIALGPGRHSPFCPWLFTRSCVVSPDANA